MSDYITRQEALELVKAHTTEAFLVQHALASEAVLCALAEHFQEDTNIWGLTGLLHDVDYARTAATPEKHGLESCELLQGKLPEEALQAIRAHNGEHNGTKPESRLDYALRCGETITGLVVTAALVRPTGMSGMEAKSLKKKMKDKAFAASVCRENIKECEKIGLDLDSFLKLAIHAMEQKAAELNLPHTA